VNFPYNDILSAKGLNTLLFSDPYARLCFMTILLPHYQKVIYVDLDTTFTAYVNAELIFKEKRNTPRTIKIYLPTEGTFESLLLDVMESMSDSSIVVFDSVNSFYNMYFKRMDINSGSGISNLNHLFSIFIMLIIKHATFLKIPVLVTNMFRYKKKGNQWTLSFTSKRILEKKSIVKFIVEMINEDEISINIMRHPTIIPQTVILQNKGIHL
jgi:hypothetical protein